MISRSAANKAGEQIRKSSPQFADDTYHDAVAQAMQWRNQHFAPTQQCFRQILDAIDDIDGAVATFRLKRLISIENKLRRANSDFKLGALDDIGGCRVILDSIDQVEQVKNALTKRFSLKNGNKIKDYIQQPQTSGYRSCGGCRVILDSIDQVEQVKNALTKRFSLKNGNKIKDYIQQPQTSGYRSCIRVPKKRPSQVKQILKEGNS